MFYWFFRNTEASDPPRPVIIWLSGGPGASSLGALFEDIGPLRVNKTGDTDDDWNVYAAEYSWADRYHLLFIDQPVDTGFSWGDSISENMTTSSAEFQEFLLRFFELYPDLKENGIYLAGESYAGKYLPLYIHDILEHNKVVPAA